ncbi:hypothetical protein pb186bvf_013551 [Paramecium bursaria]
MQLEELICPECRTMFNDNENIPLMLPDCGHTICQQCIEEMLGHGSEFCCPEDGIHAKNRSKIGDFPRNCQLLKMVLKQRLSYAPQVSNQISRQSTRNDDDLEYRVQLNNQELCSEHLEKLEIVCLTDKVRICTRCALFGLHRHHEVRSVDDVIKEITAKAESIMQIYQKIQNKQPEFAEQKYYESITEKFQSILHESHLTVKEKFKELHNLLDQKEQKLIEQLNALTSNLEQQTKKQLKELISQSLSSSELWKITAKDKLVYFSTKTENGEIPLDLMNFQEYGCVDKGKGILDDMERTQKLLDNKVQNIKLKKLRVDLKKTEIERCFDNLFTVTLQLNNTPKNCTKRSASTSQTDLHDLKRSDCQQDFFSSFIQDEPMLLKDMSLADWSETLTDDTNMTQAKSPKEEQISEFFKSQGSGQKPATPLKHMIKEKNKGSIIQQSPMRKDEPVQQVQTLRQGISPTPKILEQNKQQKKKTFKISDKFDQQWLALKSDNLEIADFSSAELQDEGAIYLCDILRVSKKVKQLKLVRNKITDEGACKLLDALQANPNANIQSLHLSSNLISERTLDYFITLVKANVLGSLPKNLYLNQTLINTTKAKKKVDDLKKLGYIVNV